MTYLARIIGIAACCLLTACGGGGGNGSSKLAPVADAPAAVTSTGRITGFGSIIMNGEEIETDDATYEKDEEPASGDDDYEKGMVVTVEAEDRDGTLHALSVSYDPELEGPIDALMRNDEDGTITGSINGKTVILSSADTHFDDISFDTIMEGDCLEVDGEMNDRTLVATYAEACSRNKDGDHEREFTAEVLEVLPNGFIIGDWTVLTDDNTEIEGNPQVGDLVEVECVDTMSANECLAKEIEPEDEFEPKGDKVHLEGFVVGLEGETFFIRRHEINVSDAPLPEGFGEGIPVRVKGRRDGGVINAESIKIAAMAAHIKAEGLVKGFGDLSFDLMLFGELVTFTVDPLVTEWDDDDDAIDDRAFDLTEIAVDDFVQVKAEMAEGGGFLALRVEREGDEGKDKVTARVEAVDNDLRELTLIGITVSADADTECKFFSGDHSCERFFDMDNGIMVDHLVKAKGMRMGNVATQLKTKHFGDDFGHDDHDIELKGLISGYIPETKHFMLSDDVEVDASMARLEPSDLMLEDGLYVEVEGEWIKGLFKAYVVELEDDEGDAFGEVTGYVTSIDESSICLIIVDGQDCVAFAINDATEIDAGVVSESFVEVEFDDAFVALEVENEEEPHDVEFKGILDDIVLRMLPEGDQYQFVVLGTPFQSKNTTRYEVDGMDVDAATFVAAWMAEPARVVELEDEIPHDGLIDEIEM